MTIQQLHKKTQHAKSNVVCVVQLNINDEPMQFPINDVIVRERSDLGVNQVVLMVPTHFHDIIAFKQPAPDKKSDNGQNEVHPHARKLQTWMEFTHTPVEDVAEQLEVTTSSIQSWLVGRWGISSTNQEKIDQLIAQSQE